MRYAMSRGRGRVNNAGANWMRMSRFGTTKPDTRAAGSAVPVTLNPQVEPVPKAQSVMAEEQARQRLANLFSQK